MSSTSEILQRCCDRKELTSEELQQLLAKELAQTEQAKAFGVTKENGEEKIKERSQILIAIYPKVLELCQKQFGWQKFDSLAPKLWNLWIPLAMQLAEARKELGRTLIQGILGGQGTGKSTLAAIVRLILSHLGYSSIDISIDDLYKTYEERKLLQKQDPRLIWRGPPGTHDVEIGVKVLDRCGQELADEPILVPRFDKSAFNGAGDRCEPESIEKVDIVLFEGWFVGVRPVEDKIFDNPPPPIVTEEDKQYARDTNDRLKEYLSLWDKLDRLIVLYPVDYRLSKQWRKEAEQKMKASGKSGMSDAEIDDFVEYFWKSLHPELFITPLVNNPDLTDLVIEINGDRSLGKVYKPGDC